MRGTPQQIIDKYLSLARDAQTSGDRVTAENFLQHAEHYQRILITATQAQEQVRRDTQEAGDGRSANQEAAGSGQAVSQPDAQPDPASAPQPEIGGMAMIDAGEANPPLLVTPNPEPVAKPQGNGEGRRRSRKPAPVAEPVAAIDETPAAAAPAEEAPADGS